MRTVRSLALAGAVAIAMTACGGSSSNDASADAPAVDPSSSSSSLSAPAAAEPDRSLRDAGNLVASTHGDLAVYSSIDATTPSTTLPARTEFGSPMTMLVQQWQGEGGEWLQVALPIRPNGSVGFVRASDVQLASLERRVDVDLNARQLSVFDGNGAVVLESPIAIGSPESPTPVGAFYVTDVLDTNNDGGSYGPIAVGTSAHSDKYTEFAGGDGSIGIHGTNDPSSIGNAVSHGCVRVPNDVVVQLGQLLPLGTSVTIH